MASKKKEVAEKLIKNPSATSEVTDIVLRSFSVTSEISRERIITKTLLSRLN